MARKAPTKRKPTKRKKGKAKPLVFLDCGNEKKGCKIVRRPAGAKIATYPSFRYTTQAKPCGTSTKMRKTCPVQLFYKKGQPHLRFCFKPKTPGKIIPVQSPQEAQRLAAAACRCWTRSNKDPKKRNFDKCAVTKGAALGGVKRRKAAKKRKR